jgi:hypothetical protein
MVMLIDIPFAQDRATALLATFSHTVLFALFYLLCDFFKDRDFLIRTIRVFFLTGIIVAFIAIIQYITVQYEMFLRIGQIFLPETHRYGMLFRSSDLYKIIGYRSVGTFYHPNLLGLYLSMVLPLIVVFVLTVKNVKLKIILWTSMLTIVCGMVCSGSRGAFLSSCVSILFIIIFLWDRISKWEISIFAVMPILIGLRFYEKIIYYLRLEGVLSYRDLIWNNTIRLIGLHPFFGIGLGGFHKTYLLRYGFPSIVDFQNTINAIALTGSSEWMLGFHAHNLFLNYAAELGLFIIPVLIFYYFIFFKEFLISFKARRHIDPNDFVVIVGCIAVIAGNLVYGFFEAATNFYNFSIGLAFILISSIGISLMLSNKAKIAERYAGR